MHQNHHLTPPALGGAHVLPYRALLTLLLSLATLLCAWPSAVSRAAGTPATGLTTQLDAYLSGLTAQKQFSGAVLVARHGSILLSKGYGMADQAHRVPNGPATLYPVGGVGTTLPTWVAALQLEGQGKLHDSAPICSYLATCPAAWKPITIHLLLDGTSGLQAYDWGGTAGETIASRLRACQAAPLAAAPGTVLNYTSCAVIVMGTILERITGRSWAALVRQTILGPAGMRHSGRLTDGALPPALARDYSYGVAHVSREYYDDFFQLYATVGDVYAFNAALFGGTLLSPPLLQRLLAPRAAVTPPDPGIAGARWGYRWKVGTASGHRVIYLTSAAHGFTIADLHFPTDDVTLVVISNDDQNNVEDIAVHLTATLFGRTIATPIMPARVIASATAVRATFAGRGTVGTFPFAFTQGALWFPTQSPNGYLGTVTRIDTTTGRVIATINVSAPGVAHPEQGEGTVVAANGQVWAVDSGAQTLVHIDPATNKVVATIHLGIPASGLSIAGDTAWAVSDFDGSGGNTIARVDMRTQRVVAEIKNAGDPYAQTAATPDALWFISEDSEKVGRIDAATNKVVATIGAGPVPVTLNVTAGSVWVGDASGALVTRIDAQTNRVVATIKTEGYPGNRQPSRDNCWCRYAVGDGSVWVIANNTTLLRIDPQTNRPMASLTFANDIGSIGVSQGSVWVATDGGNPAYTIYRVDPQAMGATPPAPRGRTPIAALLGTYRRTFQNADRIAARDSGLADWVGGIFRIRINTGWIGFYNMGLATPGYMVEESYTATPAGALTMGGYRPDNQNSFCSSDPHLDPPPGAYRWARQGNLLIITRIGFDPCLDRGALLPGRWTKIG